MFLWIFSLIEQLEKLSLAASHNRLFDALKKVKKLSVKVSLFVRKSAPDVIYVL